VSSAFKKNNHNNTPINFPLHSSMSFRLLSLVTFQIFLTHVTYTHTHTRRHGQTQAVVHLYVRALPSREEESADVAERDPPDRDGGVHVAVTGAVRAAAAEDVGTTESGFPADRSPGGAVGAELRAQVLRHCPHSAPSSAAPTREGRGSKCVGVS
jgi:hypothetical protein